MDLNNKKSSANINQRYINFRMKVNELRKSKWDKLIEFRKKIDEEKLKRLRQHIKDQERTNEHA